MFDPKKSVLLISDGTDPISFDTVEEAKKEAMVSAGSQFAIFTLYCRGTLELQWAMQTDHATNVRENKKEAEKKAPRRGSGWTEREIETLKNSLAAGTSLSKIAETLGRTYSAVYMKKAHLEDRYNNVEKNGTG